ncbi:hypothetical protein OSSY52_01510 [Tepiditoga spiralis]|uniref:DUF4416 domain-containing protein n=1 Tax=Tepiditoga spiralis TaxID=2108365 RepID=A0A7G1G1G4_9BACT|nr:DUF4416 family protein [Tepiditoga spiralis]BBE30010.1 hypothetical protein OSSY52_01510 [Tepiditoga spiralis]
MGKLKKSEMVNYVIHAFTAGNSDYWLNETGVIEEIKKHFGKIDYISKPLDFQRFTDYYNEEMGKNIVVEGRMISLELMASPAFLADAKLITNKIEEKFAIDGKRKVNLDVGYVHHTQFVLATTKQQGNRIYIGRNIYAEITLMYVYGKWAHSNNSYENFKDEMYKKELEVIRGLYLKKRKKIK